MIIYHRCDNFLIVALFVIQWNSLSTYSAYDILSDNTYCSVTTDFYCADYTLV